MNNIHIIAKNYSMYTTLPDHLRKISIQELFKIPTFNDCWKEWQPEIKRILGSNFDENNILNLGDSLSNIFKITGNAGRGQGELSASGTAWEGLICWYLNLCTVGSRVVAFKKLSLVPEAIKDAITVNYGNFACNTESDIIVVIFPNSQEYSSNLNNLEITGPDKSIIEPFIKSNLNKYLLNYLTQKDISQYELGIIQCKTNWNDNAQIPMLWDMIYSAGGFRKKNITIGRNGFSIQNLPQFTYSFVTVPSNNFEKYNPQSTSVKRVANLSGGNYWGYPTKPNIAKSLKEIFLNNFSNGQKNNFRKEIRESIPHLNSEGNLSYFGL